MWRILWRGLGGAVRKRRLDEELRKEIRFHLEMEAAENVRKGMAPEEARAAAQRRFGGLDQVEEECRDARGGRFLETVGQDLRYGLRTLRRNPAYASVAILALGLGIGANTAIFSAVHGVLLQSLPYGGGERLVRIRHDAPAAGIDDSAFSVPEFEDYRDQNSTLEGIVEYHTMWFVLLGRKEPERVQTGVVSWNFFDLLGVRPGLGRSFRRSDERHAAEAVLVLSHAFWRRSFGGDPAIVGRVFRMNDRPHTVIGILPPIPGYPDENDVYMPTTACPFRSRPELIAARSGRMVTLLRPPEEGGLARGGAGGPPDHFGAPRPAVSGVLPAPVRLRRDGSVASGGADARGPPDASHPSRGGASRPAHRVRQRCQPHPRAPDPARARDRGCGRRSERVGVAWSGSCSPRVPSSRWPAAPLDSSSRGVGWGCSCASRLASPPARRRSRSTEQFSSSRWPSRSRAVSRWASCRPCPRGGT